MIDPAVLQGRERYQRLTEGWVDDAGPGADGDALVLGSRLADPERGVEVVAVVEPSPSYVIRRARAAALEGDVEAAALTGIARLAGVPMIGGLTRKTREATGDGRGAALLVDAVIELARLARQVGKLPRAHAERLLARGPEGGWQLDRACWVDLPDSCFAYSEAGKVLFGRRPITMSMTLDLYGPAPGQKRVFVRRKEARITQARDRLVLSHLMDDNVHRFEIRYEVEVDSGRIVRADSSTPRLPYAGVCSEPQQKIGSLVGETLDAALLKRIQPLLGGVTGCAQLYDLTADLLKLVFAERSPAGAPLC